MDSKLVDGIVKNYRENCIKWLDENIIPAFKSTLAAWMERKGTDTPIQPSEAPQGTPTKNNTIKMDDKTPVNITILASGESVVKQMKNAENQIRYQYTDKTNGKTDENAVSKHLQQLRKTGKTETKTKRYEIVK
jgi:hypothetical protein